MAARTGDCSERPGPQKGLLSVLRQRSEGWRIDVWMDESFEFALTCPSPQSPLPCAIYRVGGRG